MAKKTEITQAQGHAPLPWRMGVDTILGVRHPGNIYSGEDSVLKVVGLPDNCLLEDVEEDMESSGGVLYSGSLANAEFVLRAVNSHYEMVESIKPFAKILEILATMGHGLRTYADLDDDYQVYAWHVGTDKEHIITLGDVRRAVEALRKAS